jgi:hypothetical protein
MCSSAWLLPSFSDSERDFSHLLGNAGQSTAFIRSCSAEAGLPGHVTSSCQKAESSKYFMCNHGKAKEGENTSRAFHLVFDNEPRNSRSVGWKRKGHQNLT